VRILAATNKTYARPSSQKTFREDLYFRIAAVPITTLRSANRGDDVFLLANTSSKFPPRVRKPKLKLSSNARTAG